MVRGPVFACHNNTKWVIGFFLVYFKCGPMYTEHRGSIRVGRNGEGKEGPNKTSGNFPPKKIIADVLKQLLCIGSIQGF